MATTHRMAPVPVQVLEDVDDLVVADTVSGHRFVYYAHAVTPGDGEKQRALAKFKIERAKAEEQQRAGERRQAQEMAAQARHAAAQKAWARKPTAHARWEMEQLLLGWAKRMDPEGTTGQILELLCDVNAKLDMWEPK